MYVGKTFKVFASSLWKELKKAIAELNICRENSLDSLKISETSLAQLLVFT